MANNGSEGGSQIDNVYTHGQDVMALNAHVDKLIAEKIKPKKFGEINVGQQFYNAADGQPNSKTTIHTKTELEERGSHTLNAQSDKGRMFFDNDADINLIIK